MRSPSAGNRYVQKRLTTSAAVSTNPGRLMGIIVDPNHTDWLIVLTNDAAGGGTSLCNISGEAESSGQTFFDFTNLGGIFFSSKCYATITGTTQSIYFWDGA